jgi:hypothetical protein
MKIAIVGLVELRSTYLNRDSDDETNEPKQIQIQKHAFHGSDEVRKGIIWRPWNGIRNGSIIIIIIAKRQLDLSVSARRAACRG